MPKTTNPHLGNGLAACQNCSTDTRHTPGEPKEPPQPQLANHRYFEENVCQVKLSFIVIPLHVGTYSGTKCRASRVHGAT